MANLLHELSWLEAKNEAGLTFDLIADLRSAITSPSADGSLHIGAVQKQLQQWTNKITLPLWWVPEGR